MEPCANCGGAMEMHPMDGCEWYQDPAYATMARPEATGRTMDEVLVDYVDQRLPMPLVEISRTPVHGVSVEGATDAAYEAGETKMGLYDRDKLVATWTIPLKLSGLHYMALLENGSLKTVPVSFPDLPVRTYPRVDQPWRTVETRRAEIERVQPAIRRAWLMWEQGATLGSKWFRDDSTPGGGMWMTEHPKFLTGRRIDQNEHVRQGPLRR